MMEPVLLHSTPHTRDVVREQVRAVGLSFRVPALVAAALVGIATLLVTIEFIRKGRAIDFHPEGWMIPGVAGFLFPLGVWKGEDRFGTAFLWTLPVERRRHALGKVFAGWVWLTAAVAMFVLWLLLLTLVSGGSIMPEETIRLVPSTFQAQARLDPGVVQTLRWTAHPVLWLVPFTAATGTYLLASALALGTRHPLRWIVGTVFGLLLAGVLLDLTRAEWLYVAGSRLLSSAFGGPYGLDTLLTARTESLKTEALLPIGKRVVVWRGLPDLGHWAVATLLWTGAGLAALWAAASRHREGRSA